MLRLLLAAALLALPVTAMARPCGDDLRCTMQTYQAADRALNVAFKRLKAKLSAPRAEALRLDELAWLHMRDATCMQGHEASQLQPNLACATPLEKTHTKFLAGRYRACVKAACSDLDFYNTQDGGTDDIGPKLNRYPAISQYHGADAGYVAIYTHDGAKSLYAVGGDIYVAGFIRLRGHYDGRVFQPMGYDGHDISAAPEFKTLTDRLFPGRKGGTWAGGDTGGFVSP